VGADLHWVSVAEATIRAPDGGMGLKPRSLRLYKQELQAPCARNLFETTPWGFQKGNDRSPLGTPKGGHLGPPHGVCAENAAMTVHEPNVTVTPTF